jgi:phospholipid/cholesterol/gamma-HCH transport system substrate-binding protein
MDQSKFNKPEPSTQLTVPRRTFSLELFVGIFAAAGVAAAAYLAVGLAGLELGEGNNYTIYAEFDNISGLKYGASVEIAGVPIGVVSDIVLKDPVAKVALKLTRAVKIKDDDIASIRTKGIIGDRYVKISRGASDDFIAEGHTMLETESVIDIEDVIGKVVHSLTGDKEDDEKKDNNGGASSKADSGKGGTKSQDSSSAAASKKKSDSTDDDSTDKE